MMGCPFVGFVKDFTKGGVSVDVFGKAIDGGAFGDGG
jgi:hypothetical protein